MHYSARLLGTTFGLDVQAVTKSFNVGDTLVAARHYVQRISTVDGVFGKTAHHFICGGGVENSSQSVREQVRHSLVVRRGGGGIAGVYWVERVHGQRETVAVHYKRSASEITRVDVSKPDQKRGKTGYQSSNNGAENTLILTIQGCG